MAKLISRRGVLATLGFGAAAGGIAYSIFPALPYRGAVKPLEVTKWLSLTDKGQIVFSLPRAEMGQGLTPSFQAIIASQTDFPLSHIIISHQFSGEIEHKGTVGSDTIKDIAPLLLQASAAFGEALRQRGLKHGDKIAPFILSEKEIEAVKPRPFKPIFGENAHVIPLVTGQKDVFVSDLVYENMLYGAVIHPPKRFATLKNFEAGNARIVQLSDNRIALVAPSFYALEEAKRALKTTWELGEPITQDQINAAINVDKSSDFEHKVKADKVDFTAPFDLDLRFDIPLAAHAPMEPRCALAKIDKGILHIDTASQDISYVRRHCAKVLGFSKDKVLVKNYRLGGGFGGKTVVYPEIEAAEIAKALNTSQAIKVQWTREDDFLKAFHRPPSSHRVKIRFTKQGDITDYIHLFRSAHVLFTSAVLGKGLQFATSFIKDMGVSRGAVHPYSAKNQHIAFEDVRLPIDTGPWRGLGALPNGFVVETAINEMARTLNRDPLDLRLSLIKDNPRLTAVLMDVARLADWKNRKSTDIVGYGLACGIYKDQSYVAVISEVTLLNNRPRVLRCFVSHDCGFVFNPSQVKAQIEGNLIWSLSSVLFEQLTVKNGHINEINFPDYPLPRMGDCPEFHISLINSPAPPTGAGETTIIAGVAAITNAITALTQKTVTRLPYALNA